jgi:hypothetical protein
MANGGIMIESVRDLVSERHELMAENARLRSMIENLLAALQAISDIENEEWGGDYDEIEAARIMAREALQSHSSSPSHSEDGNS